MLLEMECADILQHDIGWCGGVTELLKISALADAHGKLVVPHGSSVYSYHFVITRHNSPFADFLMMHPKDTPEIGRASCRERVCQRVECTVVLGTLTKKQKYKINKVVQ